MRIVSLLPSTTEILFAIGAGAEVVGVTFECDSPPAARTRTIVSTSALPNGLGPAEIDAHVSAAIGRGEDLYHLDRDALSSLDPDVVVTQDLCAVCAVDVSAVDDAMDYLGCRAEVVTIDPHSLAEVTDSIRTLGDVTGHQPQAAALAASIEDRLQRVQHRVRDRVDDRSRPRVLVLEWTDPPFAPGHWVPEMVTAAGGRSVLGSPGAPSCRVSWSDVRDSRPEVVVVAPCGYGRAGAERLAAECRDRLPADARVLAVDANASWARPGTRLVDGIEELADFLHPNHLAP